MTDAQRAPAVRIKRAPDPAPTLDVGRVVRAPQRGEVRVYRGARRARGRFVAPYARHVSRTGAASAVHRALLRQGCHPCRRCGAKCCTVQVGFGFDAIRCGTPLI